MPLALVTGATSLIGEETVLALAHLGYDFHLHVHTDHVRCAKLKAQLAQMGRTAQVTVCDLSSLDGQDLLCEQVQAHAASLEAIVHNAASFERGTFEELSPDGLDQILSLNLKAPLFVTQKLLPLLRASKNACVIHMLDTMYERGWPSYLGYSLSKAGLASLTRMLAQALAPKVRVNAIAPGIVGARDESLDEVAQAMLRKVPLRERNAPREIAKAVAHLIVEQPHVTGQIWSVDGGRNLV